MTLINNCHLSRSPGGQHGGKLWVVYLAMDCGTADPSDRPNPWMGWQPVDGSCWERYQTNKNSVEGWDPFRFQSLSNHQKSLGSLRSIGHVELVRSLSEHYTIGFRSREKKIIPITILTKIWIKWPYQICMKET